jgi:diguanylate cyclase (GGDEF)-like protein
LRPSAEGEAPNSYVVVLRDATRTKEAEFKLRDALKRVEQTAATDELTGLPNRRRLSNIADREWQRCARGRFPLSVLALDVDRFKLFNDRYGHLAGDNCLRALASQFAAAERRPADCVARYGGEEFVMLLPKTDHDGALHVADRVCGLVRALGIVHEGNDGWGIVTVSVGVATAWPGDQAGAYRSMLALLTAADVALYRAKNEGRNRVCSAA